MVGFRERRGQNLDKVGQTQSNIIDGLLTTRIGEIHNPILIVRIEEYGDTLVLVKFKTNWIVRLRKQSHTGTQCWQIWFCISYKTHSGSNKHGSISFMIDNMHYVIFRI